MAYTNSSLVNVTLLSPNHSGQRTHASHHLHNVNDMAYSRPYTPCLPHTVSSRRGSNWDRLLLLKSQSREQNQTYAAVQGRSAGTTFFR